MILLAVSIVAAAETAAPAAAPPPVAREVFEGGSRVTARIEGRLLGIAFPARGDGTRDVVVLLGPVLETKADASDCRTADPRSDPGREARPRLVRFALDGAGGWESIADGLDARSGTLHAHDLDVDGKDEILVGREGSIEIRRSDAPGEPVVLPLHAGGGLPLFLGNPRGPLQVVTLGAIETFGGSNGEPRFARLASAPLPIDVRGGGRRFRLGTRRFTAVGGGSAGAGTAASFPEEVGPRRLRVFRVEAGADGAPVECWARFPEPERLLDAAIVTLDGEPALVATTTTAEKLSLFGEKRLRVFRLGPDRTRTGLAPILAAETKANVWQRVFASVADVDRDGRDDLVLAYWKGLKDSEVAVETWSRSADGRWPRSPKRTTFDVPEGDRSFLRYGDDVDGDGLPDLIIAGKGSLRLHRGSRPVDRAPAAVLPLPEGTAELGRAVVGFGPGGFFEGTTPSPLGPPVPVDLDGDGTMELVLSGSEGEGARVVVYRIDRGRRR